MSIANGIAGIRGYAPTGYFIHNDAGGRLMTAKNWENTYKSGRWNFLDGFCHYVGDQNDIIQIEDDMNMAYHCGKYKYNRDFLSIEVCQSMGDKDTFLANEDNVLRFVAKKFLQYGIVPNKKTIILHKQVYPTACPHRSVELHGGTTESCQEYFINKIREYILDYIFTKKGMKNMDWECFVERINGNSKEIWYCDIKGKTLIYLNTPKYELMKKIYKRKHGKDLLYLEAKPGEKVYETLKGIIKEIIKGESEQIERK